MIEKQGVEYALFVDCIIRECGLENLKGGGVSQVAWSLGNIFVFALLASISSLKEDVKERLRGFVRGVILWDIPSQVIGVKSPEGAYHPLWDMELSPEERGRVFGVWCASYWTHTHISNRHLAHLEDRTPDKTKQPSILTMSPNDHLSITDFTPGEKWETAVCEPQYYDILMRLAKKAIFDTEVREMWGDSMKVVNMYGDANCWNVVYSVWVLEDWVKEFKGEEKEGEGERGIEFMVVEGANHFFMWDEPERAMESLLKCVV